MACIFCNSFDDLVLTQVMNFMTLIRVENSPSSLSAV